MMRAALIMCAVLVVVTIPIRGVAAARSGSAQAGEDCTLGTVEPILKDSPSYPVERVRKRPRDLVERTRLAAGLNVEVAQGGCAHYGVRMTFTTESSVNLPRSQALLPTALRMLALLKQRTQTNVILDTTAILKAHQNDPYKDGEPLQDEAHPDVTIYVTARDSAGTRTVEITYSFVL